MSDIYSSYLGPSTGPIGPTGPRGPTGCISSEAEHNYNRFLLACTLHNLDDLQKTIDKVTAHELSQGLKAAFELYFKPTCIDVVRVLLNKNSRLGIAALKILSKQQGYTYYKDMFLMCMLHTTPEEINREKLLVLPGNVRQFNVEQLLMFGANVNDTNADGETPLMLACRYGTKEMVSMLIAAGALLHTENNKGEDATVYAVLNVPHGNSILELLK